MPIVIKEIIVKTTIERAVNQLPVDEQLVRRITELVKNELHEKNERTPAGRGKNR